MGVEDLRMSTVLYCRNITPIHARCQIIFENIF